MFLNLVILTNVPARIPVCCRSVPVGKLVTIIALHTKLLFLPVVICLEKFLGTLHSIDLSARNSATGSTYVLDFMYKGKAKVPKKNLTGSTRGEV